MRLAFDLDGTLADMHAALAREARGLFPEVDPASLPRSAAINENAQDTAGTGPAQTPDTPAPNSIHTLTSRQQRELWKVVRSRENFWESLDEIEPGSLARLYRVVQERRWELIFLTSRPETAGDTAQMQSHRWLAAHGYPSPSVFVVHGSRGKIAAALALDVLVDDRPENCLDVSIDSTARAILVWRGTEEAVPGSAKQLGIGAVSSINECLDILEAADQEDTQETSMIDRLKRLLGFKPRAARVTTPLKRADTPGPALSSERAS